MGRPPKKEFFGLDMPFGEAMERYIGVKPKELHANISKSKMKKPPGSKKKRKPSGGEVENPNVISMKERKTSLRRRGLA